MNIVTAFLVVALVIMLSAFMQSVTGFGFAIVALAVLPYVMDVRLANVIVSLSVLIPLAYITLTQRNDLLWKAIAWCLLGNVLGLPIGLLLFTRVNPMWLVRGTAVAIFATALGSLLTRPHFTSNHRFSRLGCGLAGLASGVLSGSVGLGGPPLVIYASRQPWKPSIIKGFLTGCLLVQSSARILGLAASGSISMEAVRYSMIAVPFCCAGAWLGIFASRKFDEVLLRRLTAAFLMCLSAGMISIEQSPSRLSRVNRDDIYFAFAIHRSDKTQWKF